MLRCSTSLWSADLANLAAEIRRVEPFSEQFHLDVIDGHYFPQLLFFPDLVQAVRRNTARPLEVHVIVTHPLAWIEPFVQAGADTLIFTLGCQEDPVRIVQKIKSTGKRAGVALRIEDPVTTIEPYLKQLDVLTLAGTIIGIKGVGMDPTTPQRIRQARELIDAKKPGVQIEVDGGIRRETVPLIAQAGADWIVPGSLMFKEDPASMRQWPSTL